MHKLISFFISPINTKSFSQILMTALFIFFLFHTSMWFLYTHKILAPEKDMIVGDLSRLSYQYSSIQLRQKGHTNLSRQHIEMRNWNSEQYDIVTIGDSFSNAGGGGLNPYYQDYIATIYNTKVLNIPRPSSFTIMQTMIAFMNSNTIDILKPKIIIIESVERESVKRFAKKQNWNETFTKEQMEAISHKASLHKSKSNAVSIINNGNYKVLWNSIIYTLQKHPEPINNIYKVPLINSLFSVTDSDTLLFYSDDIDYIQMADSQSINALNDNFNTIAKRLQQRGTTLVFMPVVDKYNLYSPYIKNNLLPSSHFFEKLRPLEKEYYLIDTKSILAPLLPSTLDLFYADDTHWNNKASEAVIRQTPFNTLLKAELAHAL